MAAVERVVAKVAEDSEGRRRRRRRWWRRGRWGWR